MIHFFHLHYIVYSDNSLYIDWFFSSSYEANCIVYFLYDFFNGPADEKI